MTKMKKLLAVGLAGVLAVSFAACSKAATENSGDTQTDATGVKTGLAVVSSIKSVEDEKLEIDSVAAAVLVDADGKVVDVKIDEAQTKPDLSVENGDVADLRTKLEKQDDYGMKPASEIGKEWYEQIAEFEKWAIGKSADEIKAGIGEDGYPTDADLSAGCTMNAFGFVNAVTAAIDTAKDLGATATDTLKLAVTTGKSYQSNDTNLQYDSDYAAVTLNADGKITSCLIDASQAKCTIADGKFTVAEGAITSKKDLQDEYGMRPASEIQKEWFEQAEAFEIWAVGKTADEIMAGVGEDGAPSDADLLAGCTITVSSIAANVAKAATV